MVLSVPILKHFMVKVKVSDSLLAKGAVGSGGPLYLGYSI